ncbi:MAG TPA: SLC13 family permease [Smithellaceae bacterium]|nr:SLC13 family permease [Smithellaceae bacterium]HRS89897.1 SLC13 family permease [Smithellaceae bacterium]HRV26704.1 SLC13 family permease [Smithellaceae bacterium]
MTLEMLIVLGVIALAVFLFASEKIPVDLTAIIVMAILLLTGIVTPQEGLSGFSNMATVTVGAMFILSAALQKTGAVNFLGNISSKVFNFNFWIGLIGTMILVGVISAFVNNTPVVAVFIPILLGLSAKNKISPAKLLMPISFASMFGGVCTLIGTSTNILVSSIAVQHGLPAFSMFEFTKMGLVFFAVGIIYMIIFGVRIIPVRSTDGELTEKYKMRDYLTDIVLLSGAKSIGMRVADSPLVKELEIDVLEVIRNGQRLLVPVSDIVLQENDLLRVRCDIKQLQELKDIVGIQMKSDCELHEGDFHCEALMLTEVVIAPNSRLIGKTIKSSYFRNIFRATALALRHRGQLLNKGFADTPLNAGDAILVETRKENYATLKNNNNFVIVSDIEAPQYRKEKIIPALLIISGVIIAAATGVSSIMVSAIIGAVLLVAVGCISLEEAYDSVDWKVIFLLGGIISLGVALEKTGAAAYLSGKMIKLLGDMGPVAIVAALYILTSLLTETMSNNATAVLLAPIAIAAASAMGVSPKPFLMAVAFAASASFMTPVGYQTNTMIYGVGQYRFSDFIKVGTPLNLIFLILATLWIPVFFPF